MTKKVGGLQSCAHFVNLYGSQCKEMSVSKTRHTHTHTNGKWVWEKGTKQATRYHKQREARLTPYAIRTIEE